MSITPGEQPTSRYHAGWHRWARFVAQRLVLRPVVRTVTKVTVEGRDNLTSVDGSFIVVTNHSSHLDAPLVVTTLPYRVTRNLATAAAADYFYQQWWVKALTSLFFNSYPVHRSALNKRNALSARLLSEEIPVLIFPEGTRSRDGSMRPFKPGAAALSISQGVPCIPIGVIGTHEAMPVGRSWPVRGRPRVTMLIGAPMRPGREENAREFNSRIQAQISAMIATRNPNVEQADHDGHGHEEAS